MGNRYIGSTEDRINKWMRMCLQWQFDIRRGIERNPLIIIQSTMWGNIPRSGLQTLKIQLLTEIM